MSYISSKNYKNDKIQTHHTRLFRKKINEKLLNIIDFLSFNLKFQQCELELRYYMKDDNFSQISW